MVGHTGSCGKGLHVRITDGTLVWRTRCRHDDQDAGRAHGRRHPTRCGRLVPRGAVPDRHDGRCLGVAHAAVLLASDQASYITDAHLVVDGGLACKIG
jgi:NAD(P)-dependent dehydrogenase (short-subunit alcohol dehydrogenase family)